jgi:hypothetical protein
MMVTALAVAGSLGFAGFIIAILLLTTARGPR